MKPLMVFILTLGAAAQLSVAAPIHRLKVEVAPEFGNAPLDFDAVTNVTASGQQVSVTRLDFLLSNIALRRTEGGWLGPSNWFGYISAREGRTGFELNGIPAGRYDRVRFDVGVPSDVNHADPAQYPPGHPLNPDVNGLHWGWMGGYVFLALEGHWRDAQPSDGKGSNTFDRMERQDGYSFHVATDRQLMTVELPMDLDLSSDRKLRLALHVDRILSQPNHITITPETTTTHSRKGDTLADQLRENIQQAFSVERVSPLLHIASHSGGTNKVEIAPGATPYPLSISAFFPRPALPHDNPITKEGVELGRRLFFEPCLSVNNAQSCASCHQPARAFSEDKSVSLGAEGHAGTRNAMPLLNLAWKSSFFWDGRAPTLRAQVLMPIQNPTEMHETLTNVVRKLQSTLNADPKVKTTIASTGGSVAAGIDYPTLFARAFGSREITADRIARALEQFLLVQVSYSSKFDRVLAGTAKFTEAEQRGFDLFNSEYDPRRGQFGADCFHCHGGPLLQSQTFANNGLDSEFNDPGRAKVTDKPGDLGKFAVPSLRNVAVTAPYMHDGRFKSLEEVIEHYATGVNRSPTLDPNLAKHPDGGVPLSAKDKQALVAFLKTLTDERFEAKSGN